MSDFGVLHLQFKQHLFVHIGSSPPHPADPPLEAVDVRQIYDKFPEKTGGLRDLYEQGPSNAFFLVKFWVSPRQGSTVDSGSRGHRGLGQVSDSLNLPKFRIPPTPPAVPTPTLFSLSPP